MPFYIKSMVTLLFLYNKLRFIPEEKWIRGAFWDGESKGCALGHCGARGPNWSDKPEAVALAKFIPNIIGISEGHSLLYKQDTPKQRVLAALADAMKYEEVNKTINSALEKQVTSKNKLYARN